MIKINNNLHKIISTTFLFLVVIILFQFCTSENERTITTKNDGVNSETEIDNEINFNINLFVENSGSMNGYLNDPNTQFKSSLYSLLTRLKLFVNNDSLNLFFINDSIQSLYTNAKNDDLFYFKEILNPTSFEKYSKGKTGQTDINELLKICIDKVDSSNLSVFVSDCIYSPGKDRSDAKQYLTDQKEGIFLNLSTNLKNNKNDLTIVVLQLAAGFKGVYYDRMNNKIDFKEPIQRPYYIWFIGKRNQIEKLLSSEIIEEIEGGYQNKMIFIESVNHKINSRIGAKAIYGSYEKEKLKDDIIVNPKVANDGKNKGKFGFTLDFTLNSNVIDSSFLLNKNNYFVNNSSYNIEIIKIEEREHDYRILLTNNIVKYENLQINIINKFPDWINEISLEDDLNIKSEIKLHNKTFGFKYLMEGVFNAYSSKSKSIYTINIKLEK